MLVDDDVHTSDTPDLLKKIRDLLKKSGVNN